MVGGNAVRREMRHLAIYRGKMGDLGPSGIRMPNCAAYRPPGRFIP